MENLNTPDFWDKQFKDEYRHWTSGKISEHTRFLPIKFMNVTSAVPYFREGQSILDIGCGLGHFCRYMTARTPWVDVCGTDFSPFAIKHAIELGDEEDYQVAEVYKQPYADDTFHAVFAMDVIEHLSDINAFLNEIDRITRPGAFIVISTPCAKKDGTKHSEEHVKEFTPNGLINELRYLCKEHTITPSWVLMNPQNGDYFTDPTIYYTGIKYD